MTKFFMRVRLAGSALLLMFFCFAAWHHRIVIYLLRQGQGQLNVMVNAVPVRQFSSENALSARERENLELISPVKKYSVDSLDFFPTRNFETIYNENGSPTLWVITASKPYSLEPVAWSFPLIGEVTYKGFFSLRLASAEYLALSKDHDVSVRPVAAWSTLGWFSDPLLSNVLKRDKAWFCNLLFHELFHATYFSPGNVDLDENLADFVADKATLLFLRNDSVEVKKYIRSKSDNLVIRKFMKRTSESLNEFYDSIVNRPDREILKIEKFRNISDSFGLLPVKSKRKLKLRKKELVSGNACFVDFRQYEGLQDSLENVFNKIYRGNLKKMVQDLKRQ
jgi:predicted aminopeptidase